MADSRNYLKAQFTFSTEWNSKVKTAVFVNNGIAYNVLLVDDKCTVPHEVIKNPSFTVSVFGGDLITANVAEIQVQESGLVDGQVPPEPTPTVYSQLVRTVESERILAETAKGVTIQQATYAEGYKNIAVTKAEEARLSAIDAKTSEYNASLSENNAQIHAGESESFKYESEGYANQALDNILNGIVAHNGNAEAHPYVLSEIVRVEAIARGRSSAKVFNTIEEMNLWISENIETLKVGDNLYIRDLEVSDFWWDGSQAQQLEAKAINLDDYYTKSEVDNRVPATVEQSAYDYLIANNLDIAGKIYYVVADGEL